MTAEVELEVTLEPEQVPKADWQPVPQKPSVLPQYPYWLQQSPNPDPAHVNPPLFAPQRPFWERGLVGAELAGAELADVWGA